MVVKHCYYFLTTHKLGLKFGIFFLLTFCSRTRSPDWNKGGYLLSFCRKAICCSRNNSCAPLHRSIIYSMYSCCAWCSLEGERLFMNKSGSHSSSPNISRLAVSLVSAWCVLLKARSSWDRTWPQSSCHRSSMRSRSATFSTLFPLSTTSFDWGWYGVVCVWSICQRAHQLRLKLLSSVSVDLFNNFKNTEDLLSKMSATVRSGGILYR